ncbi:FUSC family protein, partial [Pseudomonas aeruginosa]|uniref:FUSC family protein n=1 Tax=Pseudomonas aeruginosa TaxID=287 RepID=UPI003CC62BF7
RQPQGLLNPLSNIVEVDAQRDHAWFEGERGRRRAGPLALLSRDLLSLLRPARGVARQRARLSEQEERRVERWLAALARA